RANSYGKNTVSQLARLYRKVIGLCRILDINYVVAHAELNYQIDFSVEEQTEKAVLEWRRLCDEFSANKIYVNIENHAEFVPDHLIALMEKVGSPYLGMCLDIGHVNAFSSLGIQNWLRRYPLGSIREVHLADNKADDDTHLPLGEGNIDFPGFLDTFAKRGESCTFVLEPRNIEEARKSLSFLVKSGIL
ncbi:MAG: hypothetical protein A2Z72_02540, partial [Omnitrophica bacterium RBG_13_46_9]